MWRRFSNWFSEKKPIFLRIRFETTLPLICGVIWGLLAWSQGKKPFDAFANGFTAFFFIFFLQGQVLRIAKNVRDDQNADEWKDSFAEVLKILRGREGTAPSQPTRPPSPEPSFHDEEIRFSLRRKSDTANSVDLLNEARRELDGGKSLVGSALTAAVGFEAAVRRFAEQFGIDHHQPMHRLIQELSRKIENRQLIQQLKTLSRLRNVLVHARYDVDNFTEATVEETVSAFEDGVHNIHIASNSLR